MKEDLTPTRMDMMVHAEYQEDLLLNMENPHYFPQQG